VVPPIVQPVVNVNYPAGDSVYPSIGPTYPAPAAQAAPDKSEPSYQGKTLDEWIKLLKDGDAKVRGTAALALRQLGPAARPAVPALIAALKDADPYVRIEASLALGKIGPDAIPALTEALKAKNRYQRMGAALALGHMGAAARS